MRSKLPFLAVALFLCCSASAAWAQQSETDRLRDALRTAIAQTRALEDERATLQAKQTESERDRERLRREVESTKEMVKAVEKAHEEAVESFNERLKERDETFDKWKAAYEEAAELARSKEAERAKLDAEGKTTKASLKACAGRNVKLAAVGEDLLERLEGVELGDQIAAREPLIGFRRIEVKNLLQDYRDKILEQRATP